MGLGSDQPVRDLKLSDLLVDDVVFVDDVVDFQCKLTGTGFEGQKVPVVLRRQGNSAVLAKVDVTVGPDGQPQPVHFSYRPTEVGQFEFVVEVEPQKGALQAENNRQTRTIQVRKEKIRVLLVQGYPSFEFRYLRNMLQRDDTIDLHTVLQDADLEHAEQDASALRGFPLRREELFAYDVVILGDVNPALLELRGVAGPGRFCRSAGQGRGADPDRRPVLHAVGLPRHAAESLAAVCAEGVQCPNPAAADYRGIRGPATDIGLASPAMQLGDGAADTRAIWQHLAPLYWLAELPPEAGARVLAEHPTRIGPDGHHCESFAFNTWVRARCCSTPPTRPGGGAIAWATCISPPYWVQTIRCAMPHQAHRRGPSGCAGHRLPRICPKASRAFAPYDLPTSVWPRPRIVA